MGKSLTLRLSDDLYGRLRRLAQTEHRSMQAQVIVLLEPGLGDPSITPEPPALRPSRRRKHTRPPAAASEDVADAAMSPETFVALYNANVPEGIPQAQVLSAERRKKILLYLQQFPDRDFWLACFRAPCTSAFLRGETPGNGHGRFRMDLNFLLSKGKDGIENCLKVYEGRYMDAPFSELDNPRTAANVAAGQRWLANQSDTPRLAGEPYVTQ